MIDRGALVLSRVPTYQGLHRPALDAVTPRNKRGHALARRYADAVVEGEGVLEDLDEALEMRNQGRAMGLDVDVVVFEVPQRPAAPGGLPVVAEPPAEGLRLVGWDAVEALEPWWSPFSSGGGDVARNAAGLLDDRTQCERFVAAHNAAAPDEPLVAVRIWIAQ